MHPGVCCAWRGAALSTINPKRPVRVWISTFLLPKLATGSRAGGLGVSELTSRAGGYGATEWTGRVFPLYGDADAATERLLRFGAGRFDHARRLYVRPISGRDGEARQGGAGVPHEARRYPAEPGSPCVGGR